MKIKFLFFALLLSLSFMCSSPSATEAAVKLGDFPVFTEMPLIRQGTVYTCGIACLHSVLRWASYKLDANDEQLMAYCGTSRDNGTPYQKILQYMAGTKKLAAVWKSGITSAELKKILRSGGVVMMPIQAWDYKDTDKGSVPFETEDYRRHWSGGHWVIACGFSGSSVLFMDPATAGNYAQMSWPALEVRWHDSPDYISDDEHFEKYEHCGIIVRKVGGERYDRNAVMPLK